MKVKVGDVVVFNDLPIATKFDVLEVNGFCIKIRQFGTDYKIEKSDTSLVAKIVK